MNFPKPLLENIFRHAEKEYPKECCGWILENQAGVLSRILPITNSQDLYHQKDPENFPRTSRNAYFMDPAELLAAHKQLREKNEILRVIYHSHVDAPAVFSAEDTRMALDQGEPVYPGVSYLIVSVFQGEVKDHKLFAWDAKSKQFEPQSIPFPV